MKRFAPCLLVLALALGLVGEAAGKLRVARVDASRLPEVGLTVVADRATQAEPRVWENDRPVTDAVARNLGRSKSIVIAVDRSRSMQGTAFRDAALAARQFVRSKSRFDRLAVIAFGSKAVHLTRFSSSTIDADGALRGLAVDSKEGTALNDTVALAAGLLAGEPAGGRVLVILTDGTDVSSQASARQSLAAAKRAGVAVYAIGLASAQFNPVPLRRLADATGGTYRETASSSALAAAYAAIGAELRRTWSIRYYTAAQPGERLDVRVRIGDAQAAKAVVVPGARRTQSGGSLPTWLLDNAAAPLFVGLAVGALLLCAVLLLLGIGKQSWVKKRLAPHLEHAGAGANHGRPEHFSATSALLAATEEAFGQLRVWLKVQKFLQRADVPLRTVEFFYIAASVAVTAGALTYVVTRSALAVLVALGVGGGMPFAVISYKARKRLKAIEDQLPDVLLTIAASLKAGHSFKQGLQTVVDEGQPPTSVEFQRVLGETRLGRPMDAALTEMAERVGSKNLEFVVTAVTIQTQVGGSLAGLFDMVADAIRQRQQFQRKVKGLTAMGRASAYVLVGLPFFIAFALFLMNREYMEPLFHTSAGHKLLGLGLVMMAVGSLLLKKIVSFRG